MLQVFVYPTRVPISDTRLRLVPKTPTRVKNPDVARTRRHEKAICEGKIG